LNLTKNAVIILILAVCFTGITAQTKLKVSKFSVSVQGGGFLPIGDASDAYKTGGNFGLGLNYKVKKNLELYAEGNYNFITYKSSTVYDGNPSIIDFKAGARYFFGTGKYQTFVEGGAGIYMFKSPSFTYNTYDTIIHIDPKSQDTTYTINTVSTKSESQTSTKFGIHAGIGEIINVAKNFDLFLKTDYNIAFTENSSTMYFGIHAGAKFGF